MGYHDNSIIKIDQEVFKPLNRGKIQMCIRDSPKTMYIQQSTTNQELRKENRTQCRKDRDEFEELAYAMPVSYTHLMRSSFSMSLLYHAYVYFEFLILACTIYILAPRNTRSKG